MNHNVSKLMLAALMLAAQVAHADPLQDGIAAWERKDFPMAHRIFTELAQRGNVEAQWQLGEMTGFGEGVPENPALAAQWLTKARDGGHKDALASLETLRQRGLRKAEIAHYVQKYDGAELSLARRGCVKPVLPSASIVRSELSAQRVAIDAYAACYNQFVAGLNAAMPPGKAIPPALAGLMSTTELDAARARMDAAYTRLASEGAAEAAQAARERDAWLEASGTAVAVAREHSEMLIEQQRARRDSSMGTVSGRGSNVGTANR